MMDRMRVVASHRELARVGVVPDDSLVSRARTHSRFFFFLFYILVLLVGGLKNTLQ